MFEEIETIQSPYALLGNVQIFRMGNMYILSAHYISKSGRTHTLVLEAENRVTLLQKALEYVKQLSLPLQDRAIKQLLNMYEIDIERKIEKIRKARRDDIMRKLEDIINRYGYRTEIYRVSSNPLENTYSCSMIYMTENEEKVNPTYILYEKMYSYVNGEIIVKLSLLETEKSDRAAGIELEYESHSRAGLQVNAYVAVTALPFEKLKIEKTCRGRFANCEEEYREWKEKHTINPIPENTKREVIQLLKQILELETYPEEIKEKITQLLDQT